MNKYLRWKHVKISNKLKILNKILTDIHSFEKEDEEYEYGIQTKEKTATVRSRYIPHCC